MKTKTFSAIMVISLITLSIVVISCGKNTITVSGVSLNKATISIPRGSTEQLTAALSPSDATDKSVSWSSSNSEVATVSDSGVVTAIIEGTATITVTTTDGSYTATCKVTVTTSSQTTAPGDIETMSAGDITFNMVYVPGGITFPTGVEDDGTATVADTYRIGETEVTYELWEAVYTWASSNGYNFSREGKQGSDGKRTDQHPVTDVNWRDAMIWTNALTEYYNLQNGTNLSCVYYTDSEYTTLIRTSTGSLDFDKTEGSEDNPFVKPGADGFRLLTSNEFELAGRYITDDGDNVLDKTGEYYPGNHVSGSDVPVGVTGGVTDDLDDNGRIDYTWGVAFYDDWWTAEVKSKHSNSLGLYDMSGNVKEWVFDVYQNPSQDLRILRMSDWNDPQDSEFLPIGVLRGTGPTHCHNDTGFRIGRTP